MNVLRLEKRGCDFFKGDAINVLSDVGNYRVGVYNHSIHAKDGRNYILEFTESDKYRTRKTNKRTGAPLLHPVRELVQKHALFIDTEFEDERGCWANLELEARINAMNLPYTRENIIKVVNMISATTYDAIEITNKG